MDRTRDLRRGRRALRRVLVAVKLGVLAVLLVAPTAGVVHGAASGPDSAAVGCAAAGRADGRPGDALIRTDQGRIRQVSFEVAWDVYEGRRPGTVLSVCVDRAGR